MAAGRDYATALAEAQRRGIAETDPSLDVEGWDTANKLVIIANSFLGIRATLADVTVKGITHLTTADLQSAALQWNRYQIGGEGRSAGRGRLSHCAWSQRRCLPRIFWPAVPVGRWESKCVAISTA